MVKKIPDGAVAPLVSAVVCLLWGDDPAWDSGGLRVDTEIDVWENDDMLSVNLVIRRATVEQPDVKIVIVPNSAKRGGDN